MNPYSPQCKLRLLRSMGEPRTIKTVIIGKTLLTCAVPARVARKTEICGVTACLRAVYDSVPAWKKMSVGNLTTTEVACTIRHVQVTFAHFDLAVAAQ